jgi:competence protein CoiA
MLAADNRLGLPVNSFEADAKDGPFFCPVCVSEVQLQREPGRIPLFVHLPGSACKHGENERTRHLYCKSRLYIALKKFTRGGDTRLDALVGDHRTDLVAVINGFTVAIQLVRHEEPDTAIRKRLADYYQAGAACIFIDPSEAPSVNLSAGPLQRYLHAMWFGELYFWAGDDTVNVVHIGRYRFIPELEWSPDLYSQPRAVYRYISPITLGRFVTRIHSE